MRVLILAALTACVAGAVLAGQAQRAVTITVHKLHAIDNLDKNLDVRGPDRADFYAKVWIDGVESKTKVFSTDEGRPYWNIVGAAKSNRVKVRIKLLDDDGGLENADDWVDINPRKGVKDLNFTYDLRSGRVYGDVQGRKGRMIQSVGRGDSDQGKIWFTIQ